MHWICIEIVQNLNVIIVFFIIKSVKFKTILLVTQIKENLIFFLP